MKFIFICLWGILCTVAGYGQHLPTYLNKSLPIEKRVKDALSLMPLEEKVKLCTAQSKFSSYGVPRLGIPELWISSDRTLFKIYLSAFEATVKKGQIWVLMREYNKIRGEHSYHNNYLLNKILKNQWAFDGCVISNRGGTHDTRQAALYGLNIEMGTWTDELAFSTSNTYDKYDLATPYLELLKNGELLEKILDNKSYA